MIICLIEFETIPGMENEQQQWLADLMPIVEKIPGFISKESYAHISGDGRISTVSYWENEEALKAWTRDPTHKEAMKAGKEYIFSRYEIRICSQLRHYDYKIKI
ncbi:MAG: antibiotic biosynthesis monooxygenase [Pseudomonadota bacterium]|nr:antibiotic biosynthesis monooxygenase [Pseudomonadota bacterium]